MSAEDDARELAKAGFAALGRRGGAAFPVHAEMHFGDSHNVEVFTDFGMSIRDWFAGQVAATFRFTTPLGMEFTDAERQRAFQLGAQYAYEMADALLAARSRPTE